MTIRANKLVEFEKLHDDARDVTWNEGKVTVKAFGLLDDGRSKPLLAPPKSSRVFGTRMKMTLDKQVMAFPVTPRSLVEQQIQVVGFTAHLDTGELLIDVFCMKHDPVYIQHGDSLVTFQFVNLLVF